MLNLNLEQFLWKQEVKHIVGIDEVGRGCLAGPVFAAAVIFPPDHHPIRGINDSKTLSPKSRQELFHQIVLVASYYSVKMSSVDLINRIGIVKATHKAMELALSQLPQKQYVLVDGNQHPFPHLLHPVKTIVKGDSLVYSIAAASILAKVKRDRYMQKLHHKFPHYDWFKNKGYGTISHRQALIKHGPTPHHRTLFIRNVFNQNKSLHNS